ncbi:MAG: XRE family transcriptional regulator [Bacteroidales bacterium]|nr:XRE family transcriptional regulator [Bacteroidales bacterium]
MIHLGKLIEEELRRQERSVAWFSRKLYCDRSNVYDIFKRPSIDSLLLLRICQILKYNFFKELEAHIDDEEEISTEA